MPIHRIQLKGPWEYEWLSPGSGPLGRTDGNPHSERTGRVTMPADWVSLFGELSGTVRFRRRFHRPTNLDPHERVFVAFAAIGGTGTVSVNGTEIGRLSTSSEVQRFEMTNVLKPFSELTVELEFVLERDGQPGGLWSVVAIEIDGGAAD